MNPVLDEVVRYANDVLVVDDGATDGTSALLDARTDIRVLRHEKNRGYGAALKTAFDYAVENKYDVLVTIDCDGQHEPQRIGQLVAACRDADMVSGSRYLRNKENADQAPPERRQINTQITRELNELLGLSLTDAFCGFKAYRVPAAGEADDHRVGLRHAARGVGAGGASRVANRGVAGAAHLSRRRAKLRRQLRRWPAAA